MPLPAWADFGREQRQSMPCMAELRSMARQSPAISQFLQLWEHGFMTLEQALTGMAIEQQKIINQLTMPWAPSCSGPGTMGREGLKIQLTKEQLTEKQSAGTKTAPDSRRFFVNIKTVRYVGGEVVCEAVGMTHAGEKVSYEQICVFSGFNSENKPRISFQDGGYEGTLSPGSETIVSEGMKFTVESERAHQ
jgi:hypothetical protein